MIQRQRAGRDRSAAGVGIGAAQGEGAGAELRESEGIRAAIGVGDDGIVSEISTGGVGRIDAEEGSGLETTGAVAEGFEGVEIERGEFTGPADVDREGRARGDGEIGVGPTCRGIVVEGRL